MDIIYTGEVGEGRRELRALHNSSASSDVVSPDRRSQLVRGSRIRPNG